jgi:hypothetical protein
MSSTSCQPGRARRALGLAAESQIIGAVGRPRPVKGYPYLLQAFARLAADYPLAHLLFVGSGPGRPELQRLALAAGLEKRVTFLDDRPDIPRILPAMDLLAMPSLHEGMSIVALGDGGRVGSGGNRCGRTPEVCWMVSPGCWFLPPGQRRWQQPYPPAGDPAQRQRIGETGQRVARISPSQNVAKTEALVGNFFNRVEAFSKNNLCPIPSDPITA